MSKIPVRRIFPRAPALTKRDAKRDDPHRPCNAFAIARVPRRRCIPPRIEILSTRAVHCRTPRPGDNLRTAPARCFSLPLAPRTCDANRRVMRGPRIDRSRARRGDRRSSIEALHVASERARRRQLECSLRLLAQGDRGRPSAGR